MCRLTAVWAPSAGWCRAAAVWRSRGGRHWPEHWAVTENPQRSTAGTDSTQLETISDQIGELILCPIQIFMGIKSIQNTKKKIDISKSHPIKPNLSVSLDSTEGNWENMIFFLLSFGWTDPLKARTESITRAALQLLHQLILAVALLQQLFFVISYYIYSI